MEGSASEDIALGKMSLGMPAAPSFRAPTIRKRLGLSLSRRHVWARHPLVLSAVIGLLGALLVVAVLKFTADDETTVAPLSRVRELAQRARNFAKGPATPEAQPSAEPVDETQAAADTAGETAAALPSAEEVKPAVPATTSKRPSTKKPTVNKLKNPFH
jgi:cytoskeletal protein RodZ